MRIHPDFLNEEEGENVQIACHPVLDWPIVTAENVFEAVFALGIKPWEKIAEPVPVEEFAKRELTPEERADLRFVPKPMMGFWKGPDGKVFRGGYVVNKPSCTVVALIEGMIPLTAEWKHGINRVTLVPPSGVPNKSELEGRSLADALAMTATREWQEETGTKLWEVIPLSPPDGITVTVRNTETRYYEFAGEVGTPFAKGPTKFDAREDLAMILMPWKEWLRLIYNEAPLHPQFTVEACAVTATLRAERFFAQRG